MPTGVPFLRLRGHGGRRATAVDGSAANVNDPFTDDSGSLLLVSVQRGRSRQMGIEPSAFIGRPRVASRTLSRKTGSGFINQHRRRSTKNRLNRLKKRGSVISQHRGGGFAALLYGGAWRWANTAGIDNVPRQLGREVF